MEKTYNYNYLNKIQIWNQANGNFFNIKSTEDIDENTFKISLNCGKVLDLLLYTNNDLDYFVALISVYGLN